MKNIWKILSLVLVFTLVMAPEVALCGGPISNINPTTPDILDNNSEIVGTIIGALQWIGYAVAIVMVLWLGIQWMLAQPAKKAELKGKMWSMAIGILLLVGGVTIIGVVWDLATQASSQIS